MRKFPVPKIPGGGHPSLPIMSWRDFVAAAEDPVFPPHWVPPFGDPSPVEAWLQETSPTISAAGRVFPLPQPFEGWIDTGGMYPSALVQVRWDSSHLPLTEGHLRLLLQTSSLPQDSYFVNVETIGTLDTAVGVTAGLVTSTWVGLGTTTRLARYVRWILEASSDPAPDPGDWTLRFSILMHLKPHL